MNWKRDTFLRKDDPSEVHRSFSSAASAAAKPWRRGIWPQLRCSTTPTATTALPPHGVGPWDTKQTSSNQAIKAMKRNEMKWKAYHPSMQKCFGKDDLTSQAARCSIVPALLTTSQTFCRAQLFGIFQWFLFWLECAPDHLLTCCTLRCAKEKLIMTRAD